MLFCKISTFTRVCPADGFSFRKRFSLLLQIQNCLSLNIVFLLLRFKFKHCHVHHLNQTKRSITRRRSLREKLELIFARLKYYNESITVKTGINKVKCIWAILSLKIMISIKPPTRSRDVWYGRNQMRLRWKIECKHYNLGIYGFYFFEYILLFV